MRTVVLLFALLAAAAAAPQAIPWTSCGNATDMGKITNLTISPFPPVGGQDLDMALYVSLGETVTNATYNVLGYYFGSEYVAHSGPLCGPDSYPLPIDPDVQWLTKGFACPVSSPTAVMYANLTLSALPFLPPGDIEVKVYGYDQNNKELFCLDVSISL